MSLKRNVLLAAVLAIAAVTLSAGSAAAATKQFNVTGHDDDGYYYTFEGFDGHNPTVTVDPGDEVVVTYASASGVHNFRVGEPINQQNEKIIGPGDEAEVVRFTVPADAAGMKIDYYCVPHKSFKMMGTIQVSGEAAEPPANETPGFGGLLAGLAVVGAVLALRRK